VNGIYIGATPVPVGSTRSSTTFDVTLRNGPNPGSLTIDLTKLYSPGVQFLGVGHSFIKFPTNIQEIDLAGDSEVASRTYDGLQVSIEAKLLFDLNKDVNSLASLYLMFPDGYLDAFTQIAVSVIRDVASEYTAFEFWTYRENVTNEMQSELGIRLSDVFANLENFLLTDFTLPTDFQTALTATEAALQEQAKVQFDISTQTTDTETAVLGSIKSADIIALQANATATSIQLDYVAEVVRVQATVAAAVAAYASLQEVLGFTDQELLTYVWLNTLSSVTTSAEMPVYLSVPSPSSMHI